MVVVWWLASSYSDREPYEVATLRGLAFCGLALGESQTSVEPAPRSATGVIFLRTYRQLASGPLWLQAETERYKLGEDKNKAICHRFGADGGAYGLQRPFWEGSKPRRHVCPAPDVTDRFHRRAAPRQHSRCQVRRKSTARAAEGCHADRRKPVQERCAIVVAELTVVD
ncbi:S41 family peptidase [Anopheles sinensis]|uniref:S41 family peptidase n=1 Tax=Anopheles sinensis TaxID=74873 RepID=A0A084VXB9_ANOSI|nr:S41 family peptidase [Anopheles sinensis]